MQASKERNPEPMKKQTLGMMIASLRKEQGMTQLELAEKMNVTDKAVSKWERDLSCPEVSSLPRLAEVFGITVDELMQVKTESKQEKKDYRGFVNMALRAVGLAMGVAVAVLSILGQVEVNAGLGMLGIGLACLALSVFPGQTEEKQ